MRSEAVYLTSSEWPSPSYIFLYVAPGKKSLDTPRLEHEIIIMIKGDQRESV